MVRAAPPETACLRASHPKCGAGFFSARAGMSDIFHEIEEDIRKERMERLWKRYGPYAIAVAVLIVLGVAGWRGWDWYSEQRAREAGASFEQALQLARDGQSAEAVTALNDIAADGPRGHAILARFRAATELAATDKAAALGRFDEIAADISASSGLRDLARIRAGYLAVDSASPADIAARIEPLAAAGNTWRHSAREILALAAWKAGNVEDTRRWAQELVADSETPPGTRARGQLLLDLSAGAAPAVP